MSYFPHISSKFDGSISLCLILAGFDPMQTVEEWAGEADRPTWERTCISARKKSLWERDVEKRNNKRKRRDGLKGT